MRLTMTRGDTRSFTITIRTGAGGPFDLTDCSLWFSVRTAPGAAGYVFQKTIGSGITVASLSSGIAVVQLTNGDTAGLPASEQTLQFDVQLKTATSPPGIFTIQSGQFVVAADITTEVS